ncbi:neural cell adhesion molecule 1 isoform X2 [Diabrotica undecimpunctata]|uniref:neural cell adhesion molecule 1 isoform X2 n=1 Tax=Diabrotica undecimpunctata TaxID=50387 RepID=UPI003B63ED90
MRGQICYFGFDWLVLFSFFVNFNKVLCLDTKEFQKTLPARLVWGVPGKDVELPCDITPALPNDNVTMLFWFKDNLGMPLYSLDARDGPIDKASHLAMSDDLGSRSYFVTEDEPSKARLRIQNVNMHDQGVFRCRVDFVNSPTRNYQVNLTLVAQPSAPRVFDAEGREIKVGHPAGPFLEGRELFLSCQVTGGRPKPTLTWWYNGTILDSVIDSSRESFTTVNQLVIASTPRYLKGAHFECRASSSETAGYISREIPVTVFLKPNKVKIVSPNDLLSISKSQNVRCETSGSYPPAKLTWLLDGRAIRNAVVTEEETESFTGSILSLNVAVEDDGKDLVCRADNPRFPGGYAEDRRQIHVAYPPRVSVQLESGLQSPVKEGTDLTLLCKTSASPIAEGYSWYHESHLIPYNETAGILPDGEKLVLKGIRQNSAGYYACSAINSEGETYSAPFELGVQYAPRCKKGYEIMRVGALPFETLVVQCHVDAIPDVARFSWTYNTSRGVLPIQGGKMENEGNVSILRFTPGSDDVESLACWATNSVGRQEKPCLFFIVPAEAPESPRSCLVRNATHGEGLEVSCIAGKDGGLHQSFILEVSDISVPSNPPGVTTLSDQGERPVFRLHSLQPGKDYQVAVYAENAKGKSYPPVILPNVRVENPMSSQYFNADDAQSSEVVPTAENSTSSINLTAIIVGLACAAVILIISIVSVSAILACKKPKTGIVKRRRRSSKPPDEFDLSEDGFGEGFHRRSAQYRASMYGECEERISRMIEGPDLIFSPITNSQNSLQF